MKSLERKFRKREAVVGVVGMGYVGLPLALEFCQAGFHVIGFDIDDAKVDKLRAGISYISHISAAKIREAVESGHLEPTTDFTRAGEPDAIALCVPTPLTLQREPDVSYIRSTAQAILPHLRRGQLIILESTTYPGTTEEVLRPILEESGLKAGRDFGLAYSPEREDPGNPVFTTSEIPRVVGGHDPASLRAACALYDQIVVGTLPVSSTQTAEAVKLLENTFRCVNIALVNELKVIYGKMGLDIWEVIEAAKTKPFGFMPFYPGPGLGGHCIPIDPFYLTWKAREYGAATRFVELAGEINTAMPAHVINVLTEALNDRGRAVNGSKILLLGVAYKKNVDDDRETPAFELFQLLLDRGALVDYHDPYVPVIRPSRKHPELAGRKSVPLTENRLRRYDVVLIATDHANVDYDLVVRASRLVVDTRNATKDLRPSDNIVMD